MYLYIKQKNMKFVYRRTIYTTPVELMFDKEYTANIVTQLYKQNITDYMITAIKDINISRSIQYEKKIIINNIENKRPNVKKTNDNDIKNLLNEISLKIDNITTNSKITTTIINDNITKSKDNENTFIPQIDTSDMEIKTNIKTEKDKSENTIESADILRQLLKGV